MNVPTRIWANLVDDHGVTHLFSFLGARKAWCAGEGGTNLSLLETPTMVTCLWCLTDVKREAR